MPKSPNPAAPRRKYGKEGLFRKPVEMALVPVQERDPDCLLHQPDVFDVMFPENRTLDDLDWNDLDGLCSCKHEAHEPVGGRKRAERKPKVCPGCRTARAANGSCFC